jgi:hypothetical protein
MLPRKDTILVVHPPGGYGKIFLWCLAYFSGQFKKAADLPPWMLKYPYRGIVPYWPSDQIVINLITDETFGSEIQTTTEYLHSNNEFLFGCTLGMNRQGLERSQDYINNYSRCFKKIVHLTLDSSCHLMILHNRLKKSKDDGYQQFFNQVIDRCKEPFGAADPVPVWQLREMVSFEHNNNIDQYQPVVSDQVINVAVRQLVHDFQGTVVSVLQYLDLPIVHDDQFDRIKNQWLDSEKFINVDSLCQHIVSAVLTGEEFKWSADQLTLIDEAYIQYLLRQNRLELRCYGLDTFPTSSVQLKELLYLV